MVRILRVAVCTLCIHSVVLTVQTAMKSRAEAALRDVPELSDTNAISAEAFGTWFKEDIMSYHGSPITVDNSRQSKATCRELPIVMA